MRKLGKLDESRANVLAIRNSFSQTIATNFSIITLAGMLDDQLIVDPTVYQLQTIGAFTGILRCTETGWYDARATINVELSSGRDRSTITAGFFGTTTELNTFNLLNSTTSHAYVRDEFTNRGTVTVNQVIKVTVPNSRYVLGIRKDVQTSVISIQPRDANVMWQRLRPLSSGE